MPKVAVYAKHKKPAKPYKKDGTLSATGERWRDVAFEYGYDFNFDGEIKVVKKYDEPNPSSVQQVKDWLFSLGWNPKTFKFVKDATGERKIPQIYVQGSGGQVCALYRDWETTNLDRKSTRLNSSHSAKSRMPSSA